MLEASFWWEIMPSATLEGGKAAAARGDALPQLPARSHSPHRGEVLQHWSRQKLTKNPTALPVCHITEGTGTQYKQK